MEKKFNLAGLVDNINLLLKRYWREILLEVLIILGIYATLSYLNVSVVKVIDGSLIVILLALPVTIYNWISGKREKFFSDNIELLVNINKDECQSDELVDLRLTQINYIYENKIKSAEERKLQETIINTVSRLVLNGISTVDEMTREDVDKIYKRLGIKKTEIKKEQNNKDQGSKTDNDINYESKFKVVNELFFKADNPLMLKSEYTKSALFVYLNYETELSQQKNSEKNVCLIANSILNINDKDFFDNFKSFTMYDSKIKFATPLTKEDYNEIKNDESLLISIKKILNSNSSKDKYFNELKKTDEVESADLEAKFNWVDKNLRVGDRKDYRKIIKSKYENSFIKFSRSYAEESEPNVRAGWFSINESTYEMIYNSEKYSDFIFVINSNPDIKEQNGEAQDGGVYFNFDRNTMKKYFDKKEGDTFAVNKDKYGKKLYQFYLYYEKDSKLLLDNRVKSGEPLKIKVTKLTN